MSSIKDKTQLDWSKRQIRDKHGRPYYLKKLSLPYRYPTQFVWICGLGSVALFWGGWIYRQITTDHSKLKPEDYWWPSEKMRGMSNVDFIKMKRKESEDFQKKIKERIANLNANEQKAPLTKTI